MFDSLLDIFVGACIIVLALFFLLVTVDGLQSWRAQQATITCAARGLDSQRYFLTSHVVCTPRASHGTDTIYVKTGGNHEG